MVPYSRLFRFAVKFDLGLMILGSICAIGLGITIPIFPLLWGNMFNSYNDINAMVDESKNLLFNFLYIGAAAIIAGWGMFACWIITGERQGIASRKEYLRSLLRQEIGWFDMINQS